ncbi:unnamed protein product [Chironomus riparius]|uniref:DNA-directed RNA polymerase I subunit D n=1 Tax=Chironomus riparius TaxID=315576 RepID=A0A9N9RXA2_9DIPT|nr:unnamed protein product [Chironomus riparius]
MGKITELSSSENQTQNARTFVIENEGNTLGNVLKNIIANYSEVEFCGYTVPHPQESKIHFRIQTADNIKAIDILRRGLKDLEFICDEVIAASSSLDSL